MGINQRPLVGMLHEHQVPMTEISRTVFKAGVGPGSRLIRESLTSSTDWCAATLSAINLPPHSFAVPVSPLQNAIWRHRRNRPRFWLHGSVTPWC